MLWDRQATGWAGQEELEVERYDVAVARLGLGDGDRVLDVGCGSGVFLTRAAAAGARVAGIDVAPGLVEIARARVPGADLEVGDFGALPWEDGAFDVVTAFNSIFFADDMVALLRELARVTRPGGRVLLQVWGDPEHCDLKVLIGTVMGLAGQEPAPNPLWQPGVLEGMLREAGLHPVDAFDARLPLEYADGETLLERALSPPPIAAAFAVAGEAAVHAAVLGAMAPFRGDDGGYRLVNEWHYAVAQANGSRDRS